MHNQYRTRKICSKISWGLLSQVLYEIIQRKLKLPYQTSISMSRQQSQQLQPSKGLTNWSSSKLNQECWSDQCCSTFKSWRLRFNSTMISLKGSMLPNTKRITSKTYCSWRKDTNWNTANKQQGSWSRKSRFYRVGCPSALKGKLTLREKALKKWTLKLIKCRTIWKITNSKERSCNRKFVNLLRHIKKQETLFRVGIRCSQRKK